MTRIFSGALLGKPIGVIGITTVVVRTEFPKLAVHMDWQQTVAVGLLSGVGFTRSILIAGLALSDPATANIAKFAGLAAAVTVLS